MHLARCNSCLGSGAGGDDPQRVYINYNLQLVTMIESVSLFNGRHLWSCAAMGKKKTTNSKVMTIRLPKQTHDRIAELFDETSKPAIGSVSAMAVALIEEAIRHRDSPETEEVARLLTHFEERITERLLALNHNLRQATGMILTPKPVPETPPDPEHLIENGDDVRTWIESMFREIAE